MMIIEMKGRGANICSAPMLILAHINCGIIYIIWVLGASSPDKKINLRLIFLHSKT